MKVKILEDKLRDMDETQRHHDLKKGDEVEVSRATGERWCAHGWAEDLDGKVPTGERIVVGGQRVNPKAAKHTGKARKES